MSVEGQWVGKYYEWACPRCTHVLQALQVPRTDDEALCRRCTTHDMTVGMGTERLASRLAEVKAERDAAEARERAALERAEALAIELRNVRDELAIWKGRAA